MNGGRFLSGSLISKVPLGDVGEVCQSKNKPDNPALLCFDDLGTYSDGK